MVSIIRLPGNLQRKIDAAASAILVQPNSQRIDFSRPFCEAALVSPTSVSWRIFKNPIALLIGGIAAVILELAEPAVRTGVWEHSSFRNDPIGRLRRTGMAAMVTVYGARSIAEPMIARIARRHDVVEGATPSGLRYSANDPRLLTWVHATATFAFAKAYSTYVESLGEAEIDSFYREGMSAARLYGATGAPTDSGELLALFDSMRGRLESSPIVFEFLQIMRETSALPLALNWMQPVLVRAAVELIPGWIRQCLGLTDFYGLRRTEKWMVRLLGNLSNKIVLSEGPAVQSCLRLGLPVNHLYG
jgi:uncharacterized protein (DUF2236 family)